MRLIDADALIAELRKEFGGNRNAYPQFAENFINNAPTVEQDSEPVAWALFYENGVVNHVTKTVHPTMNGSHLKYKPLYTSPPKREWRGLSDEEIIEIWESKRWGHECKFSRAIEAKLKELNHD